jgi:predicted Zn-dependent protease
MTSALAAVLALAPAAANARFVRDAEIENIIRSYAAPLFRAGGLDTEAVDVYLINDSRINAFVAGGQRIFLHTGLLMSATDPNQVIGVIAHETGHIVGGHLARTQDALRTANATAIVAMVLGAAAAIAGGSGGAVVGGVAGGAQVAQGTFLLYSRTQEAAADQSAVKLLNATGQSSRGLHDFLDKLAGQEALATNRQDPYLRTHPLARERVELLRDQLKQSPYTDAPVGAETIALFARMQAKLRGFLEPPSRTFARYKADDGSLPARYARAIAYHQAKDSAKAVAEVDRLLAEHPDDAYFHELKGQILFESGRIRESIPPLERSVALDPKASLLRFGLARSQVALEGDAQLNKAAIEHLKEAVARDNDMVPAWQQLAIAFGRDGQLGSSAVASAEYYIRLNRAEEAKLHSERALRLLPVGSPGWLRAQDIDNAAAEIIKKKRP